jgi:predicted Zn-dependent peptidase
VPENIFVAIVGDFDAKEAQKLVEDTFGKQPAGPVPPQPNLIEPEHIPCMLAKTKDIEHSYWYGGFLGPDLSSNDQFAADLTANILGGGRSSRLYRTLREEKQLVYNINAGFMSQRGTGVFVFSAVFEPKNENEVVAEIMKQLISLQTTGPTNDELNRAKEMLKSSWYFGAETFNAQACNLGYWHMQGKPDMIDGYVDGLMKVTDQDIIDFLRKYYKSYGLNQAVIVPKQSNAK